MQPEKQFSVLEKKEKKTCADGFAISTALMMLSRHHGEKPLCQRPREKSHQHLEVFR
jgi:hypothetical protein